MIIYPLIFLAILFINLYDAEDDSKEYLNLIFIFVSLLFIFIIIRTYFSLKNAFISNKKIQETIYYTFTNESISTKGETFDADFTWNTVYKVKENKDWFLIYQSAHTMNMVPKKFFTKDQILELRNIIRSNNVKSKLKQRL